MKNVSNKESKGITLIALVVTIIVLLLLAGISISMLTGKNGIINQAIQAKENTEIAQIREKIRLAISAASLDGMGSITYDALESEMEKEFGVGKFEIRETRNTNEWEVVSFTSKNKEVSEIVNIIGKSNVILGEVIGDRNIFKV